MAATTTRREPISVNQTEAARLLGVSEKTLRRWDRSGVITGARIGGVVLYSYENLKSLVEGQRRGEPR